MQKIKWIACAVLLSCLAKIAFAQTAVTQPEKKKIEVTGSAEMEIVPDEIYVDITVQEYYDKQKRKIDINDVRKSFLDACSKAGIAKENIFIQGINGYDISGWYWQRKKREPDFMASSTFTIKFSASAQIEKLMSMLDDNSTQNMNIRNTTHSQMETYRKQVKINALKAARDKANYLCESIGEKAGEALLIKEIENTYNQPVYMKEMMMSNMAMDAGGVTPSGLDFQKIKIRYEMMAQFAIK